MFGHERRQTREEQDKRGQDPVTEPGHRVQGRGQSVCPGLVSEKTKEGQEEDNSRTREGQVEDKTQTQSRSQSQATEFRKPARPRQGQEEDKTRTQSLATELKFGNYVNLQLSLAIKVPFKSCRHERQPDARAPAAQCYGQWPQPQALAAFQGSARAWTDTWGTLKEPCCNLISFSLEDAVVCLFGL